MNDRCFRCDKPLGEGSLGILIMYRPRDPTDAPLYTLPRMYCHECMDSFYAWANKGRKVKE